MTIKDILTKQGVSLTASIETDEGVDVGRVVIQWADLTEEVQQAITEAAKAEVEKQ